MTTTMIIFDVDLLVCRHYLKGNLKTTNPCSYSETPIIIYFHTGYALLLYCYDSFHSSGKAFHKILEGLLPGTQSVPFNSRGIWWCTEPCSLQASQILKTLEHWNVKNNISAQSKLKTVFNLCFLVMWPQPKKSGAFPCEGTVSRYF